MTYFGFASNKHQVVPIPHPNNTTPAGSDLIIRLVAIDLSVLSNFLASDAPSHLGHHG